MTRKSVLLAAAFLTAVFVCGLRAGVENPSDDPFTASPTQWQMKLRIMEGEREGAGNLARAVTASYGGIMTTVGYLSDTDLSAVQEQIRKTFNLKAVRLLSEAGLVWAEGETAKTSHTFRVDLSEYVVKVTPGGEERWQPFGIEVLERTGKGEKSLLDTGFGLPNMANKPVVFGFENSQGRPFFVCVHAVSGTAKKSGPDVGVAKTKRMEEFAKDAVPCVGDIQPPKLVKLVEPVYPDEAHKKGIEGVVILSAKIAEDGRVIDAEVLRSVPGLDEAALAALKQWIYEPMVIKGKPVKAIFTVTVRFSLK
jgi:TonB family protein